ncbi:hypothetical protein EYF80_040167 [Liparis tanakae]|uniref:Uncharacterized protein n=1 Tax=Liparis tanakae TaxID=230148 RepID=A0A4Z2G7X8_9TELE|nr:hypothetical protein EYF80_040167 [Liparis tanakae]
MVKQKEAVKTYRRLPATSVMVAGVSSLGSGRWAKLLSFRTRHSWRFTNGTEVEALSRHRRHPRESDVRTVTVKGPNGLKPSTLQSSSFLTMESGPSILEEQNSKAIAPFPFDPSRILLKF